MPRSNTDEAPVCQGTKEVRRKETDSDDRLG
jgi:hypothetical protein